MLRAFTALAFTGIETTAREDTSGRTLPFPFTFTGSHWSPIAKGMREAIPDHALEARPIIPSQGALMHLFFAFLGTPFIELDFGHSEAAVADLGHDCSCADPEMVHLGMTTSLEDEYEDDEDSYDDYDPIPVMRFGFNR